MFYEFTKGNITAGDNVYWRCEGSFLQWCDGRSLHKVRDGDSFGYVSVDFKKVYEDTSIIIFIDKEDDTSSVLVFNKGNQF